MNATLLIVIVMLCLVEVVFFADNAAIDDVAFYILPDLIKNLLTVLLLENRQF